MQLIRALPHVLQGIFDANTRFGPVHIIKFDFADGFYRICINPAHIFKLGVILPTKHGAGPMVAFPLLLGRVSAPAPGGIDRLASLLMCHRRDCCWYQHDIRPLRGNRRASRSPAPFPASTSQPPPQFYSDPFPASTTQPPPQLHTDLYMDDNIVSVQGSHKRRQRLRCVILHTLDEVYQPLDPKGSLRRKVMPTIPRATPSFVDSSIRRAS